MAITEKMVLHLDVDEAYFGPTRRSMTVKEEIGKEAKHRGYLIECY